MDYQGGGEGSYEEEKEWKGGWMTDDIPVEAWICLGEMTVEFLTRLFNTCLESEAMPEEWRVSVLALIL